MLTDKDCVIYTINYNATMPSQKDIARKLQITQATVSMALRGSPLISPKMRQKVCETAERMGYRHNILWSEMMSEMLSGRKASLKGVIGLLIEDSSQEDWYKVGAYRTFHEGILQKAKKLCFHVDTFFLRQPGMTAAKVNRILYARGIRGIILAPPYHGNRSLDLDWSRYTSIGIGAGWEDQDLNRVVYDSFHNYVSAFHELRRMGYKRIGTVLSSRFICDNRRGFRWYAGYLERQDSLPKNERIPILANIKWMSPEQNDPEESVCIRDKNELKNLTAFRAWMQKWKPDAILTLAGIEKRWIDTLNLSIPQDVGLACLAKPPNSNYAGIDEKGDVVGATALELVTAQLARNEFGLPFHPKATMIEGRWMNGATVRRN